MASLEPAPVIRPSWIGRLLCGWCDVHHEFKTRVALVGERVIRARGPEPRFCASCARSLHDG